MSVNEERVTIAQRIGVLAIKTRAAGQSKAYGDSEYEWELTTEEDIDEAELLAFCQRLLRKNTQTFLKFSMTQAKFHKMTRLFFSRVFTVIFC